ncbi:carbon monoxide dehydrogenase 1 [Oxobacter pfennigii]|uniref:Carbon monoxide dehydrogenase n=1 Tax=Oxobacter pfennigii TaxID=36849 RepID=A0A0P9AL55_9CLOT|nr:anaerobic carbon-monoxide dehydrogenase catalytic subunit [Oxobacter pfennigii]KPU46085.1 carbon monoxide dehydrogenase 1 [Oxobacter pfennigii]
MAKCTIDCSTCTSSHASIQEMYGRAQELGIKTTFDRYQDQLPQCSFGMEGVCCQLCSHGPCRITPKAPRAICGATADTIAARNLLRLACHGLSAYSHQLEEAINTLKATAEGKTPYKIMEEGKLKDIAGALGIDTSRDINAIAADLANAVAYELRKETREPLKLVELLAPKTRLSAWDKLGIIPGGPLSELRDAMTKTMSNINTDPVDLLLTTMRLSIAAGYMGLIATITLQDIILGNPQIGVTQADLGVLDTETVNIVAHGHVPYVAVAVLKAIAEDEELNYLAKEAGAKGIKLYGSMDTGQELLQRLNTAGKGFAGQLGNWLTQELMVTTGAVDLVMMDLNCSIPGLKLAADKFHTKLVSVSHVLRMDGVDTNMDYVPEKVKEQARELVMMAIEAYKKRGTVNAVKVPKYKSDVIAGVGVESLLGVLGGSLDPLLDVIKSGQIKGIVAVVGCTNNRNGHDSASLQLIKELLKKDIMVITAGCVASGAQIEGLQTLEASDYAGEKLKAICKALNVPPVLNFGSCIDIGRIGIAVTAISEALGVDPSQLPVAASAPEYLEQKAVVDGVFAIAFGLLTHLGPVPPVAGAPNVTSILTGAVEDLVGGKANVEQDMVKAAEQIEEHIMSKRASLGI